jgi:excisionase family DNA binding protein
MTRRERELVNEGFDSVRDGAAYLAIGKSQMYKLIKAGVISHAIAGGKLVIPRKALREYALSKLKLGSVA